MEDTPTLPTLPQARKHVEKVLLHGKVLPRKGEGAVYRPGGMTAGGVTVPALMSACTLPSRIRIDWGTTLLGWAKPVASSASPK